MANNIPLSTSQKSALIAAGVAPEVAAQSFALLVSDVSGGGGGTSITQAEVEAAIEASTLQLGAPTTGWTYPSGGSGLIGIVAMLYNALGASVGATISSILERIGTLSDASGTISVIGLLRGIFANSTAGQLSNNVSSANAIAAITLSAVSGASQQITCITAGYSATPTNGLLTITDGGTERFRIPITVSGPAPISIDARFTSNSAVVVSLSAGGTNVIGYLNVTSRTV